MLTAAGDEGAGGGPSAGGGIVEFRTGEIAAVSNSTSDEQLAVGQKCRGVNAARGDKRADRAPASACKIIELSAGK